MSEFDQEDGHKKWFANPDFNPAQYNVVAAEHRENRTTAEKHWSIDRTEKPPAGFRLPRSTQRASAIV